MAQSSSQKLKPLFIAIGVIAVIVGVIIGAPHIVRAISG